MKFYKLTILIVCIGFFVSGCNLPGSGSVDLIVTTFETTGAPSVNADNSVELPVRVVVRNQGSAAAGRFKVSVDYTGSQGTFVVAFTVPGQADIWYPYTDTLAAGSDVTFEGELTFHPSVHAETVTLTALADSCSGDEFMEDYCRVEESDETNNVSSAINAALP